MLRFNVVNASLIAILLPMICCSAAAAATVDNVIGIAKTGSPVADGGMDELGYAYSETLLGTSVTWGGSSFTLAAADTADAVTSTTIALPQGNDSAVNLLATAVNGNQPNQTFIVTYTDGTSASFKQSLSDWNTPQKYTGESQASEMAYRIGPSGATNPGPFYLYGYSFAINSAKTVKSITLPNNRSVVVLAVDVSPAGTAPPKSNSADNVFGIGTNGSQVKNGGMDNYGYVYSETLLGTSLSWMGSKFTFGAAGTADAVSSTTIALPQGNDSTLNLLATAVNGDQPNQTFIVTYTDGTTASFTQSLSDWYTPQKYAGETKVLEMPYRLTPSGATDNRTFYLYGYSFAINSAKTVKSLTLPNNRNVVALAVNESKTGTTPIVAAAPGFTPAPGTYTAAQAVKLSDSTSGAVLYYTTNGTTPTTSSAQYTPGTPIEISKTTKIEAIAVASGYSNSAVIGGTYTIETSTTPPKTLQISGTPATKAEVGEFYTFTPTVVASAGSTLTYSVKDKPAWAQFGVATGTLSGTPAAGSAATDANIVISVSNGTTSASLPAFNIAVATAVVSPPGSATLSWSPPAKNTNGTPLTNLAGYVVRYGTSSAALNSQVSVSSPSATSVEIGNLTAGTWYFEVAAINSANVESQFSSSVSKTIQ